MLIIGRIYLFVSWAVTLAILAIILVVILRLIANQVDLNPFGSASITLRRLTDPLVGPVRRALVGFGVDPKYAPLVTILIAILLGWFVLQLVANVANTSAGLLLSSQRGAIAAMVGYLLYGSLALYSLLIFMRIIFSWVMVSYSNRLMRFLVNTTEPLMGPLRRMVPPVGRFDISPIVAFIILWLFQAAIAGTLLRGWPLAFVA
ncbi:MAG TPA: YggT family protein [Pyrinomonadaceae bacterium]|nr:YggT family protein [Pyrinomonadaceae bacterium]